MTYKLLLLGTLSLVLLLKPVYSQDLDEKTIKSNRIFKIVAIGKSKYDLTITKSFYNTDGKEIKSIYIEKNGDEDSSILFSTYKDTLLVKQVWRTFYHRKLLSSAVTTYKYQSDEYGIKVVKETSEKYDTVIRKSTEVYRLNSSFPIDTTLIYTNDTLIILPSQTFSGLAAGGAQMMHLDRIETKEKDEKGILVKYTKCRVYEKQKFVDSPACLYSRFYKVGDTSVVEDIAWSRGDNKYRYNTITKSIKLSESEEYSESGYGDTTRVFYRRNKQQLPIECKSEITSRTRDKTIYTTKYQYFFWPDRKKKFKRHTQNDL